MPSKISLPKIGKMKYSFAPLLKNKIVLYTFLAMTIIQVVFFANNGNMAAIITMGLVGFITSFFSKNMIVILCIALTVSTILTFGIKMNSHEGLENKDKKDKTKGDKPKDVKKADKPKDESTTTNEADDEEIDEDKVDMTEEEIMEEDLKKELPEYQEVQDEIMKGVKDMEPLLVKAEAFINKYSEYKHDKPKK